MYMNKKGNFAKAEGRRQERLTVSGSNKSASNNSVLTASIDT